MKTVVLAFSGGLDTSYCAVWLREQGWRVVTVAVDTGGWNDAERMELEAHAASLGVAEHRTIDARRELFDSTLRYLIFGNVLRGNAYPLSVSAERVCQARAVAKVAREIGAEAVAHGSTGAGNDQVRFDVAFRAVAPKLDILTPIRDQSLSRDAETAYLAERGVMIPAKTTRYSVNLGLWGASVGGQETLGSWEPLPEDAFPYGVAQSTAPRDLIVGFARGIPVALDDEPLDPVELIERLNALGARHGIGRGYHLGDTILGIKGRIGFDAPAASLLITAHRELEKLVLTAKQTFWKDQLGQLYGALLHEGQAFDPLARDLEAFLESSQHVVTGDVRLELGTGAFRVSGMRSPHSLMNADVAHYGESNRLWTGAEAAAFAKVYGVQQYLAAIAQEQNACD